MWAKVEGLTFQNQHHPFHPPPPLIIIIVVFVSFAQDDIYPLFPLGTSQGRVKSC